MGVSKHRKNHKQKLNAYKANKKQEQATFKKKLMENYIKMQQESMQNKEEHTSVQEIVGPEINVDDLNVEWDSADLETQFVEPELKFVENDKEQTTIINDSNVKSEPDIKIVDHKIN